MFKRPVLPKPDRIDLNDPASLIWSREKIVEVASELLDIDPQKAELLLSARILLLKAEILQLWREAQTTIPDARVTESMRWTADQYRLRGLHLSVNHRKKLAAEKAAAVWRERARVHDQANPKLGRAWLKKPLLPLWVRSADHAQLFRVLAAIEPDAVKRADLDRRAGILEWINRDALKREVNQAAERLGPSPSQLVH